MRTLKLISLICLVAFATACPDKPSREFDNVLIQKINAGLLEEWKRYDCSARGKSYTVAYPANFATCNESGSNANGENEAIRIRAEVVEKAAALIDANYGDYIRTLDRRRSKMEFVADVIELGTGAATGISKGERPNQILGIALTAFRGGRRSSELAFYKQQTTPILISKMDGSRAQIYSAMFQKRNKSTKDYPWNEMIRDLVGYYNAGTLVRAFTELNKDTSQQAKASEQQIQILKGVDLNPIPTVEQANLADEYHRTLVALIEQLAAVKSTPAANRAAEEAKLKTKLEAAWRAITAKEKLKPFVENLGKDANFAADVTKIKAGDFSNLDSERLLTLLSKLDVVTDKQSDLPAAQEFLQILRAAAK